MNDAERGHFIAVVERRKDALILSGVTDHRGSTDEAWRRALDYELRDVTFEHAGDRELRGHERTGDDRP